MHNKSGNQFSGDPRLGSPILFVPKNTLALLPLQFERTRGRRLQVLRELDDCCRIRVDLEGNFIVRGDFEWVRERFPVLEQDPRLVIGEDLDAWEPKPIGRGPHGAEQLAR